MNREELLKQLWQIQEWFEEQEIFEYELQKKERLLKLTIEEAQADYLTEQIEVFYSNKADSPESLKQATTKNLKEHAILFMEIAMTVLGIAFIFLGMPLWQAAIWWVAGLALSKIAIAQFLKFHGPKPVQEKKLEEILEEAKASEEYQSLEHSLLADYLKLEISFLKNKVEDGRERLSHKPAIAAKNRMELMQIINMIENGEAQTIEQAVKLLD